MSYTKQTWATGDTVTADKLNHMEDGIDSAGGASYDLVIELDDNNVGSAESGEVISGTFTACETKALTNTQPLNVLVYGVNGNSPDYPYTTTFGIVNVVYDNYAYDEDEHYIAMYVSQLNLNNNGDLNVRDVRLYRTGDVVLDALYEYAQA